MENFNFDFGKLTAAVKTAMEESVVKLNESVENAPNEQDKALISFNNDEETSKTSNVMQQAYQKDQENGVASKNFGSVSFESLAKTMDELDGLENQDFLKTYDEQWSLLTNTLDADASGDINEEELQAIANEEKVVTQESVQNYINSILKSGGVENLENLTAQELSDAVSKMLESATAQVGEGSAQAIKTIGANGEASNGITLNDDGSYNVEVVKWNENDNINENGDLKNNCPWNIMSNAYPDLAPEDIKAASQYFMEMNGIEGNNLQVGTSKVPVLLFDENGKVSGYKEKLSEEELAAIKDDKLVEVKDEKPEAPKDEDPVEKPEDEKPVEEPKNEDPVKESGNEKPEEPKDEDPVEKSEDEKPSVKPKDENPDAKKDDETPNKINLEALLVNEKATPLDSSGSRQSCESVVETTEGGKIVSSYDRASGYISGNITVAQYDDKNQTNPNAVTTCDKNGKVIEIVQNTLDENGNITASIKVDPDGNETAMTYDEKGNLTKETKKDAKGNLLSEKSVSFNEATGAKEKETESVYENGQQTGCTEIIYEKGKISSKVEYKYENGSIKDSKTIKYDENGKEVGSEKFADALKQMEYYFEGSEDGFKMLNKILEEDGLTPEEKADLIIKSHGHFEESSDDDDKLKNNIMTTVDKLSDADFITFASQYKKEYGESLYEYMDDKANDVNKKFAERVMKLYANTPSSEAEKIKDVLPFAESSQDLVKNGDETKLVKEVVKDLNKDMPQKASEYGIAIDRLEELNKNVIPRVKGASSTSNDNLAKILDGTFDGVKLSTNEQMYLLQLVFERCGSLDQTMDNFRNGGWSGSNSKAQEKYLPKLLALYADYKKENTKTEEA